MPPSFGDAPDPVDFAQLVSAWSQPRKRRHSPSAELNADYQRCSLRPAPSTHRDHGVDIGSETEKKIRCIVDKKPQGARALNIVGVCIGAEKSAPHGTRPYG
jgi:hypothetical protein